MRSYPANNPILRHHRKIKKRPAIRIIAADGKAQNKS